MAWTGQCHHAGERRPWAQGSGRGREGSTLGLRLDMRPAEGGRLSVWEDGVELGTLCEQLEGEWCWMVTLTGGAEMEVTPYAMGAFDRRQTGAEAAAEVTRARAAREEASVAGREDRAMRNGTRISVEGRGLGTVQGHEQSRFGANKYLVRFDGQSDPVQVKLNKAELRSDFRGRAIVLKPAVRWAVLPEGVPPGHGAGGGPAAVGAGGA